MELTGAPDKLAFPQACANCGAAAGRRLRVQKVFEHERGARPSSFSVYAVDVPFCTACVDRHRSELTQPAPWPRLASYFRTPLVVPAVVFVVAALVLLPRFTSRIADGNGRGALTALAIVALFAVLGIGSAWAARERTRHYRVTEPTSVTAAFDFTDDLSRTFQRERHTYRLSNARFAESFVAVNASKVPLNASRG